MAKIKDHPGQDFIQFPTVSVQVASVEGAAPVVAGAVVHEVPASAEVPTEVIFHKDEEPCSCCGSANPPILCTSCQDRRNTEEAERRKNARLQMKNPRQRRLALQTPVKVNGKGKPLCCICGTSKNANDVCPKHQRELARGKRQEFFDKLNRVKP